MVMDKDYLQGAIKLKKIMSNTTVFICRQCGLSFAHYREANTHCQGIKRKFNKNQHNFDKDYARITGDANNES